MEGQLALAALLIAALHAAAAWAQVALRNRR